MRRVSNSTLLLLVVALSLAVPVVENANRMIRRGRRAVYTLATTTLEERRFTTYGDRTGSGYGYLRIVVADIPDARFFPLTRHREAPQPAEPTYPAVPGYRDRVDARMLVGIDLGETGEQAARREGYRVVHRDGRCFTAIEGAFLGQVLREDGPWTQYVRGIANVDLD